MTQKYKAADIARFWSNVQTAETNECWLWRASMTSTGYGAFSFRGKQIPASRIAYEIVYGPITDPKLVVRHTCDKPPCCNPLHLLTGTHQDNMRDRNMRGRTSKGRFHYKRQLTEADVMRIRAAPRSEWDAIAKELGRPRGTVYTAGIGQSWKHLPNAAAPAPNRSTAKLNVEKVTFIRTSGLTDSELARRYCVTSTVIKKARTGETWKDVEAPPDKTLRIGQGRFHGIQAVPAPVKRGYFET